MRAAIMNDVLRRAGLTGLIAALAVLCAVPAAAQQYRAPRPVGYVNDFAGVIDPAREREIQRVVDEVRSKSGGEIVVVTLPSLDGRPASEVALEIGRQWGVGKSGKPNDPARNTGVIVMVVPAERESRIELGYGANTFITAAESGRIQDRYMLPSFRQGDFGTGILQGVHAIAQEFAREFGFQLTGEVPVEAR